MGTRSESGTDVPTPERRLESWCWLRGVCLTPDKQIYPCLALHCDWRQSCSMLSNPSRDSHYSPVGKQNWCNREAFLQNNSCQYYTSQQAQSLIKGRLRHIKASLNRRFLQVVAAVVCQKTSIQTFFPWSGPSVSGVWCLQMLPGHGDQPLTLADIKVDSS